MAKPVSVLIAHRFSSGLIGQLRDDRLMVREVPDDDPRSALNRHPGAEILYTLPVPSPWSGTWRLKWIQLHSAGIDHVKLKDIPAHVRITTASGVHAVQMAEHAFAMLLALNKGLHRFLDFQSKIEWRPQRFGESTVDVLRTKTIGILGYGSIGREIGRLAKAFGMRVLASKRNPDEHIDQGFRLMGTGDPDGTIPEAYYSHHNMGDLLARSDVVINVMPLTSETQNTLDRRAFQAMKAGATFINIGRGLTVDEAALIEALTSHHLQAAGLDVTAVEPLPASSALWELPNVVITPHVSGNFRQYDEFSMMLFRENIKRYQEGDPLLNEVGRSRGY